MKKRIWIPAVLCLLLSGIAVFAAVRNGRVPSVQRPYRDLRASEITFAAVRLTPPDKTVRIVECRELADYLKEVVIYQRDNSYKEYSGQAVTFMLTLEDGTQAEIMAYNPFLVIDGVGYKTKYEPCEALSNYANRLLNEENAPVILDEPPALAVVSAETSAGALLGTYSWQSSSHDGEVLGMEADSAHPLDCREQMVCLDTTEETALLQFQEPPDGAVNVRCWSDAHWSKPSAESEAVTVRGDEIQLKKGGYIYEVLAEWETKGGCGGGTASYSFYIKYE